MTDDLLRRMATRYMSARELRLEAMPEGKQEEVIDAMRKAMEELRSDLIRRRTLCPEWLNAICDD